MTRSAFMEPSLESQAARDRYHALRVKRVVAETADAISIVFDVPAELSDRFAYVPGQFVTLRVVVNGLPVLRSYSMSSAPSIDPDLQVTVKRIPGGLVSNWLNDTLVEGAVVKVSAPTGAFVLTDTTEDIVAFAGGSGITPVFSIVKAALNATDRNVRLLFANRDRDSAIFASELDELAARFPRRLVVRQHEDVTDGYVGVGDVSAFVGDRPHASFYVCGPTGFMDVVETGLEAAGIDPARIHIERFTTAPTPSETIDSAPSNDAASPARVTITVGSRTMTIEQRGTSTILQSARFGGLPAPSSCEAGHCASCMARVVEGRVEMARNEILTEEEVSEGWVLTCQAVPTSPVVRVVYEP